MEAQVGGQTATCKSIDCRPSVYRSLPALRTVTFRGLFLLALAASSQVAQGGYTHYFTWSNQPGAAKLSACVKDMARILDAAAVPTAGPAGTGKPLVENLSIQFNGSGRDAHEPFVFPGVIGFNFCKTQWKPYDAVVTACLLVARDHFSADTLKIESDGQWDEGDWDAGRQLYEKVFARRAASPISAPDGSAAEPLWPNGGGPASGWSPLEIIIVGGIFAVVAWIIVGPHYAFVILIEKNRIDRVRGDAPRPFLLEVDDICRQFLIPRGSVREVRALGKSVLVCSPRIPAECRQRIRNSWQAHR